VCTAAHDKTIVTVASANPGALRFEAPSSNTMAAMLAKAPSAVTKRIRKRPSSCSAALKRICLMPLRNTMVNTSTR
jgi:hypothetical protein